MERALSLPSSLPNSLDFPPRPRSYTGDAQRQQSVSPTGPSPRPAHSLRGGGGDGGDMEDNGADGGDWAGAVLAGDGLHALSGVLGREGAGGGVSSHGVCEHHRVLGAFRAGHGDGAHLRAGLRRQAAQAPGTNSPENRAPPPLRLRAHLLPLAQHGSDPGLVRPGPSDRRHGRRVHLRRRPRPRPALLPLPSPHLPAHPEHHPPAHLLLRGVRRPPRPPQLPPRRPAPPRHRRGGALHGPHQPQPLPRPPPLHPRLPSPRRLVGGAGGGLGSRLGGAAPARAAGLRVGLPRVVVVRADDPPLRALRQRAGRGRVDGDTDPDHVPGLRLPVVAEPGGVHPGRERARRGPTGARPGGLAGGHGLRRAHGRGRHGLHRRGAPPLGPSVHFRRGDSAAHRHGPAHRRALRARQLPADHGLRDSTRQRAARRRRQHQPRLLLPRRRARRASSRLRLGHGLCRPLARHARRAGLLRRSHVPRYLQNGLGR